MAGTIQFVLILLLFTAFSYLSRNRDNPYRAPGIFHEFWPNLRRSFHGWRFGILLLVAGTTAIMVACGADAAVQAFFQSGNPLGQTMADITLIGGNFWHVIIGAVILYWGLRTRRFRLQSAGAAGIQSVLSTFIVTTGLKLLAGRRGPLRAARDSLLGHAPFLRSSDPGDFDFRFWSHTFQDGRFFWPSGHTASMFAFVGAFVAFYPEYRWIAFLGYPLALLTGLLMLDGDFHWASDVVAGGLIGHTIGWIVGKHFRKQAAIRFWPNGSRTSLTIG